MSFLAGPAADSQLAALPTFFVHLVEFMEQATASERKYIPDAAVYCVRQRTEMKAAADATRADSVTRYAARVDKERGMANHSNRNEGGQAVHGLDGSMTQSG